jgi:hypothetical protein
VFRQFDAHAELIGFSHHIVRQGNDWLPRLLSFASSAGEEAGMIGKAKSETDEKRKHDEADEELERELEDSFPASDPPSMTQPSEAGTPDHKGDKAK